MQAVAKERLLAVAYQLVALLLMSAGCRIRTGFVGSPHIPDRPLGGVMPGIGWQRRVTLTLQINVVPLIFFIFPLQEIRNNSMKGHV